MSEAFASDLYNDLLLDHGKNPRHYGVLNNPTHQFEGHNRLCGDDVYFTLIIEDEMIKQINFESVGCLLCKASASILSEKLQNQSVKMVEKICTQVKEEIFTPLIKQYPTRQKCFILSIDALKTLT